YGSYQGNKFLFSGGFMMSGYTVDTATRVRLPWANAVASASRLADYLPGRYNSQTTDDNQIYVVSRKDPDFGSSWQSWSDAVALGADFYDGDGNGVYSPVDRNGNGKWDPTEDRPDLLGDQTAWCVFTDKEVGARRRWTEQSQVGIDVQQTLFGYQSAGPLGNILFLRYRIINRSARYPVLDSVFFSVWSDPDIGNSGDDLIGVDTLRNAGYTYNGGSSDNVWGANPPCFITDFFQGPIAYIPGESFLDNNHNGIYDAGDTPLDTASNVMGVVMGVKKYPGAKNLGLQSFVNYVQSDPNRGDPSQGLQAFYYTRGFLKDGSRNNPCTDTYGTVFGPPCTSINGQYWYSGEPRPEKGGPYGWVYTSPGDVRQMENTGPIRLVKDQPIDVVVALVVGRGTNPLTSITEAQRIDDFAQFIYNRNFESPPSPPDVTPVIRTTENSIDLFWKTAPHVNFRDIGYADAGKTVKAWDMQFQGYEVSMYRANSTSATEGGMENSRVIARYDIADNVDDVLSEDGLTGERTVVYRKGIQLSPTIYGNPVSGQLALHLTADPFTGGPLIKGKPYYFAITAYALNTEGLAPKDSSTPGSQNYIMTSKAFVGSTASFPAILNNGIRPGIDFNDPYVINTTIPSASGTVGDVSMTYEEMDKGQLTGEKYRVDFVKKTDTAKYFMYWRLKNETRNTILLDSQITYNAALDSVAQKIPEGFLLHVSKYDPALGAITDNGNRWYRRSTTDASNLGVFYLGTDLNTSYGNGALISNKSKMVTADRLRQVEIRFGPTQKAYRYVKGALGGYVYAAKNGGSGFVDVPFQAWVKDGRYGETRQLTCGFFETTLSGGKADGIWNPGVRIDSTKEYIVIFDRPYSPDSSIVYTGGTQGGVTAWADITTTWTKPSAWPSSSMSRADSIIAKNPYFDGLYIVGLARDTLRNTSGALDTLTWRSGDIVTINMARYPIIPTDAFAFTTKKKGQGLSGEDRKSQFSRVTVFPNPLLAYNSNVSYDARNSDETNVTFSNLPVDVTIRIFTVSGSLVRTLTTSDKTLGPDSPFLNWNLQNSNGLRVASGMYFAIVSSPGLGEKILKLALLMPQKQIRQY
ncbi:MAG: T9SS type A sorting domain-containing protein, partial [Ignavibacteriales bacterium]|nr:T9SS type A sorting domain-containing protein [Ignavibacteriales bacterium]